jgi:hypothetical protein
MVRACPRVDQGAANPLPGVTDVPSDLSFLLDLRRRVRLPGNGPHGLAIVWQTLYAAEYFSDSLAVVGLETAATGRSRSIPLGPAPHPTERDDLVAFLLTL